jgi:hypothetical protein
MEIEAQHLIDAIEDAGFEAQAYSGRGMSGKQCVGVVVEGDDDLWEIAQDFAISGLEIQAPRTDSLGLDTILYWPNVLWPAEAAA